MSDAPTLEGTALEELRDFLLGREVDIAMSIENFGDLKNVFEAVIGRAARPMPLGVTVMV